MGAIGAPQVAGGTASYDPDFIEPEDEGKPQVDLYSTANIGSMNQSVPNPINHGLIGAYNNRGADGPNNQSPASSYSNQSDFNHVVKLDYGFPFDGYVRHRSNIDDDGIEGPRQCWIDDTADCVGIITARAKNVKLALAISPAQLDPLEVCLHTNQKSQAQKNKAGELRVITTLVR